MEARVWWAFAAVSVLWGIPYFFIKVAIDDGVPPVFLSWARVVIGASLLLAIAQRRGTLGTLGGRGRPLLAYALLEICVPFPLIAFGERHVASSLAAIVIAAVPLFVAVLAVRFDPAERAQGLRLVGLLVGLAGVVALVGLDVVGSAEELLGVAAVLVAAAGYAAGPLVLKRHLGDRDPLATMGASLGIAAVILTPLAALDPPAALPTIHATEAVVVLGVLCTAAAFATMAWLVARIGPGRALVITYVNPAVALALGVAFLGERPGAGAVVGLLLILAGSWLSTGGRLPAHRRARRRSSGRAAG